MKVDPYGFERIGHEHRAVLVCADLSDGCLRDPVIKIIFFDNDVHRFFGRIACLVFCADRNRILSGLGKIHSLIDRKIYFAGIVGCADQTFQIDRRILIGRDCVLRFDHWRLFIAHLDDCVPDRNDIFCG